MKLYYVTWNYGDGIARGYIKAETAEEAARIAREKLQKHCKVESIQETHVEPNPQSITLNFENTATITLFG